MEAEIGLAFLVEHYRKAYSWNPVLRSNHYLFAVPTLLPMLARHMDKVGLPRQIVDLVFDDRKIEEPKVLEAWFSTRDDLKCGGADPPDVFEKIFVNAPVFRSSRDIVALQAADMFVGSTRKANIAHLNGGEFSPLPGTTKNIRGIYLHATADGLREEAERQRNRLIARGLL